ncbi:3-phosphoshikimate 1-carboxyvinyltransferase [Planctomicrobium piriforme]|uniref:3-phosphoshikimate 1-carboxyvinyltransferase n=1 Tax=Planctomicrobium piriforme TaxID=1576369 RepID=A0A1I3G2J0_9PLAN|nr:3-phosphoshikimate 1-carboxyvinyltransferase [Planctomicrobium piriforme]SFI17684.1 3-phosphoshikimate 1-carboxyvinyltransferase [Planctomicrobium piriforme]
MESIDILPVLWPLKGRIRPPGSKSLTNRALIIAALAQGPSHLTGVLDSVDTQVMIDSLGRLQIPVSVDIAQRTFHVNGQGGKIPSTGAELWCENSGTSIRFLTALCAAGSGRYRLDGNSRMRERPIAPLVAALASAGVKARCELENDCPPVQIETDGLPGGRIRVGGDLSSQYLSALLMAAPAASAGVTVEVTGELVSRPYVDMTLEMMRAFGANIHEPQTNHFEIAAQPYVGRTYDIEPDASAASYFFAAAAVTGGEVTVLGLHRNALQGDVKFVDALVRMGCEADWGDDSITLRGKPLHGIDIDMNEISDTAQTLACVAPFASGPTRIRNVAHMRLKETDRVSAVVTELQRVGLTVEEHQDGMTITPGPIRPAEIHTYDDHRMAMSFSLLGLKAPGIRILDPGCTAKTYPEYFTDLDALCRSAR